MSSNEYLKQKMLYFNEINNEIKYKQTSNQILISDAISI